IGELERRVVDLLVPRERRNNDVVLIGIAAIEKVGRTFLGRSAADVIAVGQPAAVERAVAGDLEAGVRVDRERAGAEELFLVRLNRCLALVVGRRRPHIALTRRGVVLGAAAIAYRTGGGGAVTDFAVLVVDPAGLRRNLNIAADPCVMRVLDLDLGVGGADGRVVWIGEQDGGDVGQVDDAFDPRAGAGIVAAGIE